MEWVTVPSLTGHLYFSALVKQRASPYSRFARFHSPDTITPTHSIKRDHSPARSSFFHVEETKDVNHADDSVEQFLLPPSPTEIGVLDHQPHCHHKPVGAYNSNKKQENFWKSQSYPWHIS